MAEMTPMVLVCQSGPDMGKRLMVGVGEVVFGRSSDCGLLSDDPEVGESHLSISAIDGKLQFRCQGDKSVFLGGAKTTAGVLEQGQQLRVGRSYWQLERARGQSAAEMLASMSERISSFAHIEKVQGFSFTQTFSEVFSRHSDDDIEDYFTVGTRTTTPALKNIDSSAPKPWIFFRLFLATVVAYLLLQYGLVHYNNSKMLPGLMVVGSFLLPLTLVVLFFETNVARNVSLYQLIKLALVGGILALVGTLFISNFDVSSELYRQLGSAAAGPIEEFAKLAVLMLVVNKTKYRWTLNGLLFGAAVGCGFSAFESAGYAFDTVKAVANWASQNGVSFSQALMKAGGREAIMDTIQFRGGILVLLTDHTLWTAMVGAALWRVKQDQLFNTNMLTDPRFWRVFVIAVVLHMVNNTSFGLSYQKYNLFLGYMKPAILGFVAWVVIIGLIQHGLREIRMAQQGSSPSPSGA